MKLLESKKKANQKWNRKNLKRYSVAFPVDFAVKIDEHLKKTGESFNGFVKRIISEAIKK